MFLKEQEDWVPTLFSWGSKAHIHLNLLFITAFFITLFTHTRFLILDAVVSRTGYFRGIRNERSRKE